MPIDYKEYPPKWTAIRTRILKRAKNCCEFCGLKNGATGHRMMTQNHRGEWIWLEGVLIQNKEWFKEKHYRKHAPQVFKLIERKTKIVLTIAHLDHDKKNWNVRDERLKALCQLCHLLYDVEHKKQRRKERKIEKRKHNLEFA